MRYVLAFLAVLFCGAAQAQDALVVQSCGTLPQAYSAGATRQLTVDINGKLCSVFSIPAGPGDVAPTGLSVALCLHRCINTYTGPLVTVVRASDSAVLSIPQDALGNLDQAMCAAFQGASTLAVSVWFDQTINGNNAAQVTGANRPTLVCSVPQFGGLPGVLYSATGCGATNLQIPPSPSWSGFSSGANPGSVLETEFLVATTGVCNARRWDVGNTDPNQVQLFVPGSASTIRLGPGYSTSNANFVTTQSVGTTVANIVDVQYQWTLTTNTPTITINGGPATLATNTAGVGTAGVDTSLTWTIGNNGGGGPVSSFPGYINSFLVWKSGPGATQIEAARKAEGTYYGISVQ